MAPARESFSDDDIRRALREAAAACGEPLSHTRYDSVAASVAGPSSARVIQRFGSWREACGAAGVASSRPVREYDKRWDAARVAAAVAEYLTSGEGPPTYAGYAAWAQGSTERPSGATVRNVLGTWSAAKRAATAG